MLFEPDRHLELPSRVWDERVARDAIARVVDDAARAFDGRGFPVHPLDEPETHGPPPPTSIYWGTAGVVWAIDHLARAGVASAPPWLRDVARATCDERSRSRGFLMGRLGALAVANAVAPDAELADALLREIEACLALPSNELMLGAPGAVLVATRVHARTGDVRFAELARRGAVSMWSTRDADGLFSQRLFGGAERYLGLVHGFAGNAAVLLRAAPLLDPRVREEIETSVAAATERTAVREGELASWPATAGERPRLMQICHGAPGFVVGLAGLRASLPTLSAAGAAIERAGPLRKGTNLCHGDAGNGYAFLALHAATGDATWLDRARAFAMNAIARCDATRSRYGQGRYSLWTGDLGLACFLWGCVTEDARFPTIDTLA
ncbi:MAG: LanC-like protein [Deltaproteobacteria bacterium]|nr:LanC-like protein [Deltaproteobacteria bacterium]